MISKLFSKLLIALGVLTVIVAVNQLNSFAQETRPTGTTVLQSSQLVYWYDAEDFNFGNSDRDTIIQLTNGSFTSSVCVHVQVYKSYRTGEAASAVVRCEEADFFDCYTPRDTHYYVMDDEVFLNQGRETGPLTAQIGADDTKGFVVVTPIASLPANPEGDTRAISFQHLFGHSVIIDEDREYSYRLNAMGRDAVDFAPGGGVLPDGTVLDGVSGGYVLIQPDILKFNFTGLPETDNEADVVSIAFSDDYDGGINGGYTALPADAVWDDILVFNDVEARTSCDQIPQNCFFDIGINDEFDPANRLLDGGKVLCSGTSALVGWAKIEVTGLADFENEFGAVGLTTEAVEFGPDAMLTQELIVTTVGGADWMHAE